MDLTELAAREAIRDLVARYAQGVDRGRFTEVAALFADDGVLELPDGRSARGHDGIAAVFSGAGTSLRAATGTALVRHHVTTHTIALEAPHDARGAAYFVVFTDAGIDHWGCYLDHYSSTNGAWRFASRRVRIDGRAGAWSAKRS